MDTVFVGRNIIFLPEVDSTNSYASNLLKNVKLPEGSVVHTTHQTHGKGQRGSVWMSETASNLSMSVILFPEFLELHNQFYLYQISALASHDTIAEFLNTSQYDIKIKWPNDILINRQKASGILIENTITDGRITACIIGIGINVNQLVFDSNFKATSIKLVTGKQFEVSEVLPVLCKHLEKYYLMLRRNNTEAIQAHYMNCFFAKNDWIDFEIEEKVQKLKVNGISKKGLLLLEDANGKVHELDAKDARWLY